MIKSKKINVTDLDFEEIKSNLISYLQGQEQFQDYDFTGSNLNILLDILAYNTHYNNIYKNLAINEVFLDSASKRNNVVSRAKDLGYIPKSATCSKALIDIRVTNTTSTPEILNLPKYTTFSTFVDGEQFTFYTTDVYSAQYDNSGYLFENIPVKEGSLLTFQYVVDIGTKYIIPNQGADLSTLKVRVKENTSSLDSEPYTLASSILDIDDTSLVYFVKEIDDELYEIEFGDGILGKALDNGNVIMLEYIVTNKDAANKAKSFTYQGSSLLGGNIQVTTKVQASGGSDIEDIESVRYATPKYFAAQNRGVIPQDFVAIIKKSYPTATVSCWGGEDNNPPVYGKVFICVKPADAPFFTANEKEQIKIETLKGKKVLSIVPELLDPRYIYVEVKTSVYYNPNMTSKSSSDIGVLITEIIQDYNQKYLQKFGSGFRESQLSRLIDTSDNSIVSNITTINLHVPVTPFYNTQARYEINLGNPIRDNKQEQNIKSTGFTVFGSNETHYLDDDGTGVVRLYTIGINDIQTIVNNNVGTVDYSTGSIIIPNLNITTVEESFKFIVKPESYDVMTIRDQIVEIPDELIEVNVIVDNISAGNTQGGTNYIYTSSRS